MQSETNTISGSLHVADLAHEAGVTPATVRYYARTGLIHADREPDNGYRCFSGSEVRRILFIRQAQALGLTIGDIKTILEAVDDGDVPCSQVIDLVERRLTSIKEKIVELVETAARIDYALSAWEQMNDAAPAEGELCPLIERLDVLNSDDSEATRQLAHHTRSVARRWCPNSIPAQTSCAC